MNLQASHYQMKSYERRATIHRRKSNHNRPVSAKVTRIVLVTFCWVVVISCFLLLQGHVHRHAHFHSFLHHEPSTTTMMDATVVQSSKHPLNVDAMERQLEQFNVRYYVHSDPRIAQPMITENLLLNRGRGHLKDRFRPEALLEHHVLDALERHPLRTYNAQEAAYFIIPLRMGASIIHRGLHIPQVMAALAEHPKWNDGHGHVILALNTATFSHEHKMDVARHGLTKQVYHFFANVTVVKSWDDFMCAHLTHHSVEANLHNYKDLFAESRYTMSRYGFSIGLLAEPSLPYIKASYQDKFQQVDHMLFYHTRINASFYNSTPFRHAPLQVTLPNSQKNSIGFDLNQTMWLKEFINSKYCLAIRGDTPHTHALIRAVKVGCIPVVVSDYYPLYAPTFASTVDMKRFSVFLPEVDFLKDPKRTLEALAHISPEETKTRIKELQFAQRVLLYDHPQSLFVPAFMKEVQKASIQPPSVYSIV